LDASRAGRGGQADAFGQFLVGDARVALQFGEDAQVVAVEGTHDGSVLWANCSKWCDIQQILRNRPFVAQGLQSLCAAEGVSLFSHSKPGPSSSVPNQARRSHRSLPD